MIVVDSYTIYHSANSYIGTELLRRALADLPSVLLRRRPIYIPHAKGLFVADLLDGKENRNAGSYHREDCARWAEKHGMPLVYPSVAAFTARAHAWQQGRFQREELPARAFYAAPPDRQHALDRALFRLVWEDGKDANEPETIACAADEADLDPTDLLQSAEKVEAREPLDASLDDFLQARCPGVPTAVIGGARFFGKDRIDWVREYCLRLIDAAPPTA